MVIWPLAETGAEQHQSTVWQNARGASMAHQYTPAGTQALAANSAVAPSDANTLRAPIILRGDRIGFTTLRRRPEDAAWTDREVNHAANHFFLNTLETLDSAYLRPRFNGYLHFQDRAAPVVHRHLRSGEDLAQVIEHLTRILKHETT